MPCTRSPRPSGAGLRLSAHKLLAVAAAASALLTDPTSASPRQQAIPAVASHAMTAANWTADGVARFDTQEGFPSGLMTLSSGIATLNDAAFSTGTIEFDMKALDYSDTGIMFHRRGSDAAEFVYLRADPECPAANDCIQYAPITHGLMQWDIYPQYQHSAPISEKGWNHVRIVVAGRRMQVFVNREVSPSLDVACLQGLSPDGGFAVKGPAVFVNLVVEPDRKELVPSRPPPELARDAVVTNWFAGPVTPAPIDREPSPADLPREAGWQRIAVEPNGLVNLSREFGTGVAPALSVAWLRFQVPATADTTRMLHLGYARQAWLFVNGMRVFAGDNPYYPAASRLAPEGRLEPDNALIPLHLHKGNNEIVLAVENGWRTSAGKLKPSPYGWGAMASLDGAGMEP